VGERTIRPITALGRRRVLARRPSPRLDAIGTIPINHGCAVHDYPGRMRTKPASSASPRILAFFHLFSREGYHQDALDVATPTLRIRAG